MEPPVKSMLNCNPPTKITTRETSTKNPERRRKTMRCLMTNMPILFMSKANNCKIEHPVPLLPIVEPRDTRVPNRHTPFRAKRVAPTIFP